MTAPPSVGWRKAPGAAASGAFSRLRNPIRAGAVQRPMTCDEFIEAFSDLVDETGSEKLRAEALRHRDACADCRRYEEVYRGGLRLLETEIDEIEVSEDFHLRLQHRLFHVDDERALARSRAGVAPSSMVLGAAAVMAALLAVPPFFEPDPEVELSPIVVSVPSSLPAGLRVPLPTFLPASLSPSTLELRGDDLWRQPAALFYPYAPVRARYRNAASTGLGLE